MEAPCWCFLKDAGARQEKLCRVFAGMEIKTFQVGFVPIGTAFHAHWHPKAAAHSDLDRNSKPSSLGFGKCLFLLQEIQLLPELTHSKPLSVHFLCSCPSLALRDLFGTNYTEQTLFQTISHAWLSLLIFHYAFANIHYLPKTYLELRSFLFFQILIA